MREPEEEIKKKIWQYVVKTFLGGSTDQDRDSFSFSSIQFDSLSHVKMIFFIEKEFGVALSIDEASKESLANVNMITQLVLAARNGK